MKRKIKRIAKNIIEFSKRFFNRNDIFILNQNNQKIKFFLPLKYDYLQQQIIVKNKFYENEFLLKIKKYMPRDAVVIDAGANIGNHLIYFVKVLNAKEIYGFEPQKKIFNILKKNVFLNNIQNKTKIYNLGLGEKNCKANFNLTESKHNSGAVFIEESDNGEANVVTLDSMKIREKIDFIKIDTEGFELKIIRGAKKLIKRDKPILFIEIQPINEKPLIGLLKSFGYKIEKKLDKENYLFVNS